LLATVCPERALVLPQDDAMFFGCLAETARAVPGTFAPGKVLHVNFLTGIHAECACMPVADSPVVPDIGILAATDITAGDKNIDPCRQVAAAAALGLGSPDYELVPVTHRPKPDGGGRVNPFGP